MQLRRGANYKPPGVSCGLFRCIRRAAYYGDRRYGHNRVVLMVWDKRGIVPFVSQSLKMSLNNAVQLYPLFERYSATTACGSFRGASRYQNLFMAPSLMRSRRPA